MKWLNLLFAGLLVFVFNACQQHPVSDLKLIQSPEEQAADATLQKKDVHEQQPAAPADDSKPAAKYY
jgi:hypothetical protein